MAELDYVQKTTNSDCTATSAATANVVITGNAINLDGATIVVIEYYCVTWTNLDSATVINSLELYDALDGGTAVDIGRVFDCRSIATLALNGSILAAHRRVPVAGSHVFSIRGWVGSASTFSLAADVGGVGFRMPMFVRVTDADS